MPFFVIQGTYHVVNYSPDGDSIRFGPRNPEFLELLRGPRRARINARGHVQLRIEGIDTLETHFNPGSGGGTTHQPLQHAEAAREAVLGFVGITNVAWNERRSNVVAADDGTPGYILSRSVEKNGRPVAFVFSGEPPAADGSEFFFDVPHLRNSYNFRALADGLAYATYYTGLFPDLRDAMTEAVAVARQGPTGLYADDVTSTGFDVRSLADITDRLVILPKLFRRLVDYLVSTGSAVGFKRKLEENREPVLEIATAHFTHFDTFVEQADGASRIKLTRNPEELVFDEMPQRPTHAFADLLEETEDALA